MIDINSARLIGGVKYGFVCSGERSKAAGIAMRIRASGGVARVVHTPRSGNKDEAWVVYANDRGRSTARTMMETFMEGAA